MMEDGWSRDGDRCFALLIDPLKLRRAQIAAFLKTWADAACLTIIEADRVPSQLEQPEKIKIAIMNTGALGLHQTIWQTSLAESRQYLPNAPVVIISDCNDAPSIVSAFRSGARGFIPSVTEPEIALQALTFILGGGTYYPPSAIDGSSGSADGGATPHGGNGGVPVTERQARPGC